MIEGSKIRLRDMLPADLDVYRQWNQPGQRWQELDGPYYSRASSDEVEDTIRNLQARIETGEWPPVRTRLVIADRASDVMAGVVSRYWISQETAWAAMGIVIYDPAHWGQRWGFEALGLWTDYLFQQEPSWVRLDLRTWSGNIGMVRLAAKLGYKEEARFRQARIVNGQYYDALGFGILRSEWQELYPDGFQAAL